MGVALQLALLRHPGITLAQLIQDRGAIPHDLAAFVAEQLGLHVTDLANYATRDQTMTDPRISAPSPLNADSTVTAVDKGVFAISGA